jgi:hypothetical protein
MNSNVYGSAGMIARATVPTAKPVAYMRQLCKHFGHRVPADYDEHTGRISFEAGTCELVAGVEELALLVTASDDDQLGRLEGVIGSHLERFGRRDELTVEWDRGRADASS